jgi:hypothetical protein
MQSCAVIPGPDEVDALRIAIAHLRIHIPHLWISILGLRLTAQSGK